MPLILQQVQGGAFQTAAGVCTNSSDYFDIINEVVPRLMERGDWPGTIVPIQVCVRQGCVTWPRYVGKVRKINHCRGDIKVKTVWHEFLEQSYGRGIYGWQSWCREERNMTEQFKACTYNDIPGPNCTIRIYPTVPEDVGATVTIFGVDNNQQPLQTNNGDGTYSQGITLTAALPFGSSGNPFFVSKIDRVVKSVTQSNLLMYAYDTVNNVLFDLAVYEPSEINPQYERYRLDGRWNVGFPLNGACLESIIALVKLKFIPVSVPSDLIPLNSRGAIKLGIKAWKSEDAGDLAGADAWWARAVEMLNRNSEDENPDSELTVQNFVVGNRMFSNRMF